MSMFLSAAGTSDLGLVRSNNEDCMHVGRRLVAIADGMGGMPAGELASDTIIRVLAALEDVPDDCDPAQALRGALQEANLRIGEAVRSDPRQEGMGSTVTALLMCGGRLALLHVGDSRCYLLRDRELSQVTRDDTFVQSLVDRGVLTAAQARVHPQRSLVTQAVQGREDLSPTELALDPHPGDRYLLCSDGLSDIVAAEAIGAALASADDPQLCAESLVKLAIEAGGTDNVTVVVADVRSEPVPDPSPEPSQNPSQAPSPEPAPPSPETSAESAEPAA
jgi:serine/threonine protein phosphatase PrpC